VGDQELTLKFDPLTIEHLGYKMYSHLPNALAELIANAYDADARTARVVLAQRGPQRTVTVEDDGHGMSLDDLNEKYLRIGRNRRAGGQPFSESGRRRVAGKKGLGKLALFGIGESIRLVTKRRGQTDELHVHLEWANLKGSAGAEYHPNLERVAAVEDWSGTRVELRSLRRKTDVNPPDLAVSLGRLFNYLDDEFQITVIDDKGTSYRVDRTSKLDALDADREWSIPEDLPQEMLDILGDASITGRILAAAKPVPAENRGVALYAKGRLANEPEFYGISESSFAFSYLTGYLDVDYIDDEESDSISTDRRSVSWDSELTQDLRDFLQEILRWVARERRDARRSSNTEKIKRDHGVDVPKWVGSIQGPEREAVQEAADVLTSPDSVMADEDRDSLLGSLRRIAPEYADLHWRHLHPKIQGASRRHYAEGMYHTALGEAMKLYLDELLSASELDGIEGAKIVNDVLGEKNRRVDVAAPYTQCGLNSMTLDNMRDGQHKLSQGIVAAFRNPLAHQMETRLQESGALTYNDCLDGLSLISHLYARLEKTLSLAEDPDSRAG
jgi:uncharacterized protein (TIGR02391 family)